MADINSLNGYNKPDFSSVISTVTTTEKQVKITSPEPKNTSNKDKVSINNSPKTNASTSLEFVDSSQPSKTKIVNGTKIEHYDSSVKNAEEIRNKLKPFNINVNGGKHIRYVKSLPNNKILVT
ncbi:MAG: hypothetical protein ACK4IX_18150, partial [Candidatus Sericytochromatia bacterium]